MSTNSSYMNIDDETDGVYKNGVSYEDNQKLIKACRAGIYDEGFMGPEVPALQYENHSDLNGVEIAKIIMTYDVVTPLHAVLYETSGNDSVANFKPCEIDDYEPPTLDNLRAALKILRSNSKAYGLKQRAEEQEKERVEYEKEEILREEKVMGIRLFERSMGFVTRDRASQAARSMLGDFEQQISNAFEMCKDSPKVKEELMRWLELEMEVKHSLMDIIEKTGLRSACVRYDADEVAAIRSSKPPTDEIDPRLDVVPMTRAPLAAMITEQGDYPVAFNIIDPEGMMPQMCVTPNKVINVGGSGHTSMNFVANMNAYWDACEEMTDIESGVFRRRIENNNPYIASVDIPLPCFSRVNLRNTHNASATINQQMMSGIKAVPICAKLTANSMGVLPEVKIPGLPRITCGATSVQMYTVLNATTQGREYLEMVNEQYMDKRTIVDEKNYEDYVHSVMNITKLGEKAANVPCKDHVAYTEDVTHYLKILHDGSTSLMQVLADDRGLATNIQTELAVVPSCAFYIWKLIHDRYPMKTLNGAPINGTFYQARALYRFMGIKPLLSDRADIMGMDTNVKTYSSDDVHNAAEVLYEWEGEICKYKRKGGVEGPIMVDLTVPCKRHQSLSIRKVIAGKKNTKGLYYKTDYEGSRSFYTAIKDSVDFAVFYVSYQEINSTWFCNLAKSFEVSVVPTAINVLYGTYFAFERRVGGFKFTKSVMTDLYHRIMGYASQKFAMMKTLVAGVFKDISVVHGTYERLWGNDSLIRVLRTKISVRNYPKKLGKAEVKGSNPVYSPISGVYDMMKIANAIDFGKMQFEDEDEMVVENLHTNKKRKDETV